MVERDSLISIEGNPKGHAQGACQSSQKSVIRSGQRAAQYAYLLLGMRVTNTHSRRVYFITIDSNNVKNYFRPADYFFFLLWQRRLTTASRAGSCPLSEDPSNAAGLRLGRSGSYLHSPEVTLIIRGEKIKQGLLERYEPVRPVSSPETQTFMPRRRSLVASSWNDPRSTLSSAGYPVSRWFHADARVLTSQAKVRPGCRR